MDLDRRASSRRPVRAFFNKYIDREPHLGEIVELSSTGMLVRTVHQPETARACYAIELRADPSDEPLWLCASPIWAGDGLEALAFVAASDADRRRLDALVAQHERAA